MITEENRNELEEKGYTVVPGVLTEEECDRHIASYQKWLESFQPGTWPQTAFSLIQKYHVGHMEPTWSVRLKAYPVFSQLWKTEKLLSSMDAISIGRPPEQGEEKFWSPEHRWLHCDQSAERIGLHAYQGGVYLEHCDEDDWTFEVVEGSHKVFEEYMKKIQDLRIKKVSDEDLDWLAERNCIRKRVSCPKGGMVLWDSRLIHANLRPVEGRAHPGRWRYVVFVCMAPAAWADSDGLETKAKAYNNLDLTGHWPCNGIISFNAELKEGAAQDGKPLEKLPDIALTDAAKRLVGIVPYDDNGEEPPSYTPQFNDEKMKELLEEKKKKKEGK